MSNKEIKVRKRWRDVPAIVLLIFVSYRNHAYTYRQYGTNIIYVVLVDLLRFAVVVWRKLHDFR